MQLTRPRGNFIEKIIRDANGKLVRASFCVYEERGHVKARLLSAVYVEEHLSIENKIPTLGGDVSLKTFSQEIIADGKISSPYFSSNILYFSGSKPRAPTI